MKKINKEKTKIILVKYLTVFKKKNKFMVKTFFHFFFVFVFCQKIIFDLFNFEITFGFIFFH